MKSLRLKSGWVFWTVIVLTVLGFNLFLIRFAPTKWEKSGASTYHVGPYGLKALYLTLQESGVRVGRKKTSLRERPPKDSILVMMAPERLPDMEEMLELRDWVADGGVMLLGMDLHHQMNPFSIILKAHSVPGDKDDKQKSEAMIARSTSSVTHGVRTLAPPPGATIISTPPDTIIHLDVKDDSVLVERRIGKGRVFVFSCPEVLQNSNLTKADNLRFFLNIVRAAGPDNKVLFDEHHHDYTGTEWRGTWGFIRLLFVTPYGLFALLTTLGLVFWLLNRDSTAVRPERPYVEAPSSLDHIQAVANLHKRLNAGPYAARRVLDALRRDLAERLGAPPDTPTERLFDMLRQRRADINEQNIQSVLAFERKALSGAQPDDAHTLDMAQCAEAIRKDLRS